MKRLFVVEIAVRAVVAADDETSAHLVAEDARREIVGEEPDPEIHVLHEVKAAGDLPTKWDIGCFPYGVRTNHRIGEYLQSAAVAEATTPAGAAKGGDTDNQEPK